MMRLALIAASCVALAACSASNLGEKYGRLLTPQANPSTVIATELAFARTAQEKGQWTAFREYAADGATMFTPEPVAAREWLGKQTDPAQAVRWQPHGVWSSCDGTLAVTRGAAQWPNGTHGEFMTVWQRQSDGEYRWVADIGQTIDSPLPAPDFIATRIADCKEPVPAAQRMAQSERPAVKGQSADGSLQYLIHRTGNGTTVTLGLWDGTFQTIGPKVFAD